MDLDAFTRATWGVIEDAERGGYTVTALEIPERVMWQLDMALIARYGGRFKAEPGNVPAFGGYPIRVIPDEAWGDAPVVLRPVLTPPR